MDIHPLHRFSEAKGHAPLPHLVEQLVHDFAIQELQGPVPAIHDRDLDTQGCEHRRVFDADHASAHHDHGARQTFEAHDLVAGDGDAIGSRHSGRSARRRPHRHHDPVRAHAPVGLLRLDEEGMGICEGGAATNHRHIVATELIFHHAALAADDLIHAREQLLGRRLHDRSKHAALQQVAGRREGEHRFPECLTRNGACLQTHAAHDPLSLDEGSPLAKLGRLHRCSLPGGPAPHAH